MRAGIFLLARLLAAILHARAHGFAYTMRLALSYSVFGLLVRSNLPLPGVPPFDPVDSSRENASRFLADLHLHLGVPPARHVLEPALPEELIYASSYLDEVGRPVLRILRAADASFLHLLYCDGTQFWLDPPCEHLWATWPGELSVENTLCYVLGPVFGLVLRFRGVTCLHASAVAIAQCGVVFVGAEGAGKSTTAAALAKRGHPVLSDDIAAVVAKREDPFCVLPAYPHLCLWPDSAEMVRAPHQELPRLSSNWDKLRLNLGSFGTAFASRPLPLGAVYLLTERALDSAPGVTPATGKAALMSLVANTYANNLLDRAMRAQEFSFLDRLIAAVPVRWLTPHRDPARLEELCDLVEWDLRGLREAHSAPQSASTRQP